MTGALAQEGGFALVTEATSPLGGACVERLRADGIEVAFTGADRQRGEALAQRAGAHFLFCHPADRSATDTAVQQALTLAGDRIRVLVTLPRPGFPGAIQSGTEADFVKVLEANLTMAFRTGRACFQALRSAGGGSMIHVASDAGIRAAHERPAFSVASAGVIAVAELFAGEGAAHGIRANAVCPGGSDPEATEDAAALDEEVASTVAWLASAQSAGVSGATLRVDAGAGAAMVVYTRA